MDDIVEKCRYVCSVKLSLCLAAHGDGEQRHPDNNPGAGAVWPRGLALLQQHGHSAAVPRRQLRDDLRGGRHLSGHTHAVW